MQDTLNQSTSSIQLSFHGKNGEFLGMKIYHVFMTIITLGIFYFWAKAASLRYIYQNLDVANGRFAFHGTGKEMFKGFLKTIAVLFLLYALIIISSLIKIPAVTGCIMVLAILAFLGIIPYAIHGSLRYRLSRTSWRGISFTYKGNLKSLYALCTKGILLSIVTIGIYGSWFQMNLRRFIFSNIQLGTLKFTFNGKGKDFFFLNLKGVVLSVITLGIYGFWYFTQVFSFMIENTGLYIDSQKLVFKSKVTPGAVFSFVVGNICITLFTLGIGIPIVILRGYRFFVQNVTIEGEFDPALIKQTEKVKANATGEELATALSIDGLAI